jgi:L-fuculose-phosphate aldolase
MHGMELLEWACGVYWHAAQLGTPHVMDASERQAVVDAVVARGYGVTREAGA